MSVSVITIGGQSVNLVAMPSFPGMRTVEFEMNDAVGIVMSTFTGQLQAQQWPGADMLRGTMTLPVLQQADADNWISFLMQLRGMANAFRIGDPLKSAPRGSGSVVDGAPFVDNTVSGNLAMSQSIDTKGWTDSADGVLLAGDYMQVGYRLYRVLDTVDADDAGNATIPIWPSLREVPEDSSVIVLNNTVGLFRLATNKRTWSADVTRLSQISFQIQEYR